MIVDTLKNQIICIESGSRGKGGALTEGIPSLGAEHLRNDGNINWNPQEMKYISPSFFKTLKAGILQEGDVLVVKDGATTGKICYVSYLPSCAAINEHVFLLRTKASLHSKFLFYYLQSRVGNNRIMEYYHGATVGGIGKNIINIEIPFPPLDEQRKIAAVLDKVSDLIAKRRRQLDLLNQLVKSRFIEMFGDPVTNSKGLVTRKGSEFFTLTNGKFVPGEKRRDEGIPAYGGNGISWYTDEILVTHDTIVVGRVGFQSGNVHFVTGPLWVTDNAMYISDFNKDQYDLRFLCALMEHIDFTRFQDAGDLKKITQKPFMQMSFIAPSIQQQKSFITFVEQVDKSKLAVRKSLEKLETLKKALMQQYFG